MIQGYRRAISDFGRTSPELPSAAAVLSCRVNTRGNLSDRAEACELRFNHRNERDRRWRATVRLYLRENETDLPRYCVRPNNGRPPPAPRAFEHVDLEHSPQKFSPRPIARRPVPTTSDVPVIALRVAAARRHNLIAPRRTRRQDPVICAALDYAEC